ncbi:hypothetical protein MRB53_017057 [Persea americana]|uniref:Uncharacterized protein n=1 Tax=Persea americana TaxID=3435 RepID=A0ACC2M4G2_PERAE|nr:hypothetical protein MRB53_017057 [Persea americana]
MEIAVDTWVNYSRLFSISMVLVGRSEPLMGSIERRSRPLRSLATWSVPARSRCGVDWSRFPDKRRLRKCPPHVPITCVVGTSIFWVASFGILFDSELVGHARGRHG